MEHNFITTKDAPTATLLLKQGYQKVQDSNGIYVFLNTDKFQFSNDIDITKIQYRNMLTF